MRSSTAFLLTTMLACALYLPLLSQHYDENGLHEARALELGVLFFPNHLLLRPLAAVVLAIARLLAYGGPAFMVLRCLTALAGAAAVGFLHVALRRLAPEGALPWIVALGLGVTRAHWTFSTDISYVTLAAFFASASLALFVHSTTKVGFALTGLLAGLAILTWQANVFLLAPLLVAVLLRAGLGSWRDRALRALLLVVTCASLVSAVYLAVGLVAEGLSDVRQVAQWSFGHGHGHLPLWGTWRGARAQTFAVTALRSICASPATPLGLAALALLPLSRRSHWPRGEDTRALLWLLTGFAAYVPFLVWWDPYSVRWLVIPNLFVACALGVAWRHSGPRLGLLVPLTASVLCGAANFRETIWPKHSTPSDAGIMAECVANHLAPGDLLVATDWEFGEHLMYLHRRETLGILAEVPLRGGGEAALDFVRRSVAERQRAGHQVFMRDPASYPREHLDWLTEQTGIAARDLSALAGKPAFECQGHRFSQVAAGRP